MKTRVILVGIGGATCSGKTTLAKHLRRILPNSVIIHQDDFAPPQEKIPIHPVYGVQDWDRAEGAIEWPRMVSSLEEVKRTGEIPPEHVSHDHLNEQKDVPIDDNVYKKWKAYFERVEKEHREKGGEIKWVMVDGFLLYWHPEVVDKLDVRIFLRVPHDVLKQRRHERHGYHTAGMDFFLRCGGAERILTLFLPFRFLIDPPPKPALSPPAEMCSCLFSHHGVQSDPEGSLWRDPPNYWEQIVWPAYVEAHQGMLEHGDVEHGKPNGKVPGLLLLEGLELSMSDMVDRACGVLEGVSGGDGHMCGDSA